jgi:hypothetical protein
MAAAPQWQTPTGGHISSEKVSSTFCRIPLPATVRPDDSKSAGMEVCSLFMAAADKHFQYAELRLLHFATSSADGYKHGESSAPGSRD